jgi:hypothetical protein
VRLVTATLRIYLDAGREAGKAFARSAWALVALLICFPALFAVSLLVAPLGFLGGFIYAFAQAACAGTYLASLKDALTLRRSMGPQVLRANLGRYTWEIIGALFPIYLVNLLLGMVDAPTVVHIVVDVAIALFLNPVPEMIGRSRAGGVELLRDAATFMMTRGPEWLVPQVVLVGLAVLVVPAQVIPLLQLFGPSFGFVTAGGLALSVASGTIGWVIGFVLLAAIHFVMLFRGALYERLSGGGRRAREWAERFR